MTDGNNNFDGQTRSSVFTNQGANQFRETLFDLPVDPEQFGVQLAAANLRNIDFSALEFATARRALVEYIKTYFPDDFNDFVANNGIIMILELVAYVTSVLSLRGDILANEAFLPTARTEDAVVNHLALISQKIKRATPAVVDIEVSISNSIASDVNIAPGQIFQIVGEDGDSIDYEVFKAPDDFESDLVIPAGKKGVIAFGIEGRTQEFTGISEGIPNQKVSILDERILEEPVRVFITSAGQTEEWDRVEFIEKADPDNEVFEVRSLEDELQIVFGDNIIGKVPPNGATITVRYRTGGGRRGRIGAGVIDETRPVRPGFPFTATVEARFRNLSGSVGGEDKESLEEAKKRAPRDFATRITAVTAQDYAQLIESFNHPTFGSVAKSLATIRTGLNANRVELHVLAEGVNGVPVTASVGLKKAIETFLEDRNVLTDHIVVLDAIIRKVDLDISIIVNRRADPTIVKREVDGIIDDFFDINKFDLGQPLFVSTIYDAIHNVDGISHLDIFKPSDNVLSVDRLAEQRELEITVSGKTVLHPSFGTGSSLGYQVDGIEGKTLNLELGITYAFNVTAPEHPFHITRSDTGGNLDDIITTGIEGDHPTESGTIRFTPTEDPNDPNSIRPGSVLFYQSGSDENMGGKINIVKSGVSKNELITLGDRQLQFFFEKRSI